MQIGVLYWRIELVEPGPSNAELPVLPDDVAATVDEEHTVVRTALFAMRSGRGASGNAGACHQSEIANALGVIGADGRTRRDVAWTASELPHDIATGVDFNNAIVELIGDEDVAGLIEFARTPSLRDGHRQQNGAADENCGGNVSKPDEMWPLHGPSLLVPSNDLGRADSAWDLTGD